MLNFVMLNKNIIVNKVWVNKSSLEEGQNIMHQ